MYNVFIQDEALYVAVKMNYADDIEGLLQNGAKSTFCDYVSSSCYFEITNVFIYNIHSCSCYHKCLYMIIDNVLYTV